MLVCHTVISESLIAKLEASACDNVVGVNSKKRSGLYEYSTLGV